MAENKYIPYMRAYELREKSTEELKELEKKLREQLFKLRFKRALGVLENKMAIRNTKKTLARVLTILRERELSGGK
jgi:large subunit ribosomal protein L29